MWPRALGGRGCHVSRNHSASDKPKNRLNQSLHSRAIFGRGSCLARSSRPRAITAAGTAALAATRACVFMWRSTDFSEAQRPRRWMAHTVR
eukprot:8066378-Pyramimonas_sp.AAC.1